MSFGKFACHPFAHLFAHEHRVRADVNDPVLFKEAVHERFDVRINQWLTAADRDHRRVAFLSRAQTVFQAHHVLERGGIFPDPSAAGACEITGVQRLELQDGCELLRTAQLVPDDVGGDFRR